MTARRLAIVVVGLCASSALRAADPIAEAETAFAAGRYLAGRKILVDALDVLAIPMDQRARITDRLARFYEQTVGSRTRPQRYWQAVTEMPLPTDHPAVVNARRQLERLAENDRLYAEADRIVSDANFLTDDDAELRARIADLRAAARQYPDYPHMARLHHTIGVNSLWLKEYGPAIAAFDEARQIRPAIDLIHPTSAFREMALIEWMHQNVPTIAWSVIAGLVVIWLVAFVALRRWRRLRWRHALVAGMALAGWCAVFFGAVALVKDLEFPKPVEAFVSPIEIHASLGQTGAEPLQSLFWCGLAAVAGSVLFTTVSGGIRRGWLRLGANLAVSLALSGALIALVYLKHYSRDVVFLRTGPGAASYLSATFNFHVKTIEANLPEPGPDEQEAPANPPGGGEEAGP